jgi:predicted RNase H-like HicB family nuclease
MNTASLFLKGRDAALRRPPHLWKRGRTAESISHPVHDSRLDSTQQSAFLELPVVLEKAPEGGYACHLKDFPQIFSEGETMRDATKNLIDALRLVLAYHAGHSEN